MIGDNDVVLFVRANRLNKFLACDSVNIPNCNLRGGWVPFETGELEEHRLSLVHWDEEAAVVQPMPRDFICIILDSENRKRVLEAGRQWIVLPVLGHPEGPPERKRKEPVDAKAVLVYHDGRRFPRCRPIQEQGRDVTNYRRDSWRI